MKMASEREPGTAGGSGDHWRHIARAWRHSGPPLRVSPQDAAAYADAVATLRTSSAPPRVLILGVTPEIYALPWPRGTDIAAVDRSDAMIAAVWPGPQGSAQRGEWSALPLPGASRDLVLCDGGVHLLSHPDEQVRLVRSVARVLAPGGLCLLRLFVPPSVAESPDRVVADLRAGCAGDVNVLKLRLGMAMQEDPRRGVRLADVWRAFSAAAPDPARLAERNGWTPGQFETFEAYRDSTSAYHFVSVDDVARQFCDEPGGFVMERVAVPTYVLGERCPLVVLRRTEESPR